MASGQDGAATMRPEDVPQDLPDHPEEAKLRKAEMDLAQTLTRVTQLAARQLRDHDRVAASVTLAQIAQTAAHGQKAMARAVQDQMDAMGG